jgi:hypothetical protein
LRFALSSSGPEVQLFKATGFIWFACDKKPADARSRLSFAECVFPLGYRWKLSERTSKFPRRKTTYEKSRGTKTIKGCFVGEARKLRNNS